MGYRLEPLTDRDIAEIADKRIYPHYPPLAQRLRFTRQEWRNMTRTGALFIPDDARYHVADHPNRYGDPSRLTPIHDNARPMGPRYVQRWHQLGLATDTAGRPLHPHAGQLLTTVGMCTGPGWSWHYGPQVVGNALAYCVVDGQTLYAMVETRRGRGTKWSLAGGHADSGETPEAAAWRELLEEAGIDARADGGVGGGTRLERLTYSPQDTLHAWQEEWFSCIRLPWCLPLGPRDRVEVVQACWMGYDSITRLGREVFQTHFQTITDHRRGVFA